MSSKIFTNISLLVNTREGNNIIRGKNLSQLPSVKNAYLVIDNGIIAEYGSMNNYRHPISKKNKIDKNCMILPCWCDSHTHLVFAGSRENEFVDKLKGLSYADIAANGGGILNSAKKLNETSEDELFNEAWKRLEEVGRLGTGAIEIKSGYGLSLEGELKMLRVIRKLKEKSSLQIKSTFLGAHSFPLVYRDNHSVYIKEIIEEMLPVIAREKLADYIDVFCENGFFNPEESETILKAGMRYGLEPKMHVNQLNAIGGIEKGIKLNAVSMDH